MEKVCIIIQARSASTRLPNKILLPFWQDKNILEILVERLKKTDLPVIIATSLSTQDNIIEDIALKNSVFCYRGSENDVLQRFIDTAKYYDFENIIRVCSDNPFLDINSISELLKISSANNSDYTGYYVNNKPGIQTHFGLWPEYVTLNSLEKIVTRTNESCYHEHVTNYIYTHSLEFNISWIKLNSQFNDYDEKIRFTVDTEKDFKNMQLLISLCNNDINPDNLIKVALQNQSILNTMMIQIHKNAK